MSPDDNPSDQGLLSRRSRQRKCPSAARIRRKSS